VDRELVLVRVKYSSKDKAKVENIIDKYVGKLIKRKEDTAIIEMVGEQVQIREFLEELKNFGIKELVRTGRLAISF
jgi:acetolactate synthase-1/3 small subunit